MLKLLCIFSLFFGVGLSLNPLNYFASRNLTSGYKIYWKIENSTFFVGLEVNTTGWIGFGIAETSSGSMPGADILVAKVENGVGSVEDRHAVAKLIPILDSCSHWTLISFEETAGWTIIEASRPLFTNDTQDREIVDGYNRIIFAWGGSDTFAYHEANRRATSINFNQAVPENILAPLENDPNVFYREYLAVNYSIPATETTYMNFYFQFNFTQDAHIVGWHPVVDPNNAAYVHHYFVYGCLNASCANCQSLWAWAPGIESMVLPSEAGIKVGVSANAYKCLRVQTHYDNRASVPNLIDNSGVRIYFTYNLRPNDASLILVGDAQISNPRNITRGQVMEFEYDCPSQCTSTWPSNLNVYATLLHMHEIGVRMWMTLWRGGVFHSYIDRIEYYDFNFQQNAPTNIVLQPGDRLSLHCVYQGRPDRDTIFRDASQDEMCIAGLYYYPATLATRGHCAFIYNRNTGTNFTMCHSTPMTNLSNPSVADPPGAEIAVFGQTPGVCQAVPSITQQQPTSSNNPTSQGTQSSTQASTDDDMSTASVVHIMLGFVASVCLLAF